MTHFIDHTLPAHDPDFPKPRGLLPVPPEVAEWVAREEARFLREHGLQITPEARQRMLDNETLHYYYDDAYIAYRRTPQGVEVLAVGWEEARGRRLTHQEKWTSLTSMETIRGSSLGRESVPRV
jgi:hypothetical protein